MRKTFLHFTVVILLSFSLAANVAADLTIKSRYTTNFATGKNKNAPRSYERTVYFKGVRQREDKSDGAIIYQCDLKQWVWYNNKFKSYSSLPQAAMTPEERAADEAYRKEEAKKKLRGERARAHGHGGVLTITTTTTDTGERREMFGYTARHIITKSFAEASPTACDQYPVEMETDGWYIDLLYGFNCSPDLSGAMGVPGEISSAAGKGPYFSMPVGYLNLRRKPRKGCSGSSYDDVSQYKRIGTARFGYPVLLTVKQRQKDTRTSIATHEVTDIINTELDQSLFEVPASFTRIIPKYGVAK